MASSEVYISFSQPHNYTQMLFLKCLSHCLGAITCKILSWKD